MIVRAALRRLGCWIFGHREVKVAVPAPGYPQHRAFRIRCSHCGRWIYRR